MPAVSFCPQKTGEQQDGPLLALLGGCSNYWILLLSHLPILW